MASATPTPHPTAITPPPSLTTRATADAYVLETAIVLPRTLNEVFPFFASPENLEAITPPWLNFQILTPRPLVMRPGAIIDYKIRLRGIPIRWRTVIAAYEPPGMFIDRQIKGPYWLWEHTHTFEPVHREGRFVGTRIADKVRYLPIDIPRWVPGLGGLIHRLMVRPDLEKIFAYRQQRMRELLAPETVAPAPATPAGA
ncbi:MAG TPA: SRPBCC family protein [Phycisphaerales bacterium]